MQKQTGLTYKSASYAKALFLAESKVGKSSFLVASALGLMPWQRSGGVVDRPENLHVLTFDSSALAGISGFLVKTCRAPEAALNFNVYNFQDDARKGGPGGWEVSLYENVLKVADEIRAKAKQGGTHVVIISSLTGLAQAMKRGIAGPVKSGQKSSGMDQAKWDAYGASLSEIRNAFQDDAWHCFFEAHVHKTVKKIGNDEVATESLLLEGKSGQGFALNVEQIFTIRRQYGVRFEKTNCDQTYLDTKPTIGSISNGRGFNELLDAKEPDLTVALSKLGLKVGNWQAAPAATAAQPQTGAK